MELKHLRFFKRTAELQHMTKAASELQISQPFLSRAIAELEEDLGVKLFDHVGRGIVLNDCGKAYYERISAVFRELEDARREVNEMSNRVGNSLTIVTSSGMYVPKLLERLRRTDEGILVHVYSAPQHKIARILENGQVDYAISCPPVEERGIDTELLMQEEGAIIYPAGHWLSGCKAVTLHQIADEPFVCGAPGYGTRVATDMFFSQYGITMNLAVETTDTRAIFDYVESGAGISITGKSIVLQNDKFKNQFASIDPPLGAGVGLSRLPGRYQTRATQVFLEVVREYFNDLSKSIES